MYTSILNFEVEKPNPVAHRSTIISSFRDGYDDVFNNLHNIITFTISRSVDFSRMERDARAAIQAISDRTSESETKIKQFEEEAEKSLDTIRKTLAEQGVSQQAYFYKEDAENHERQASLWLSRTVWLSVGLGVCAIVSFFLHKIPFIRPENAFDAIQLAISKVLIFFTITYMLVLSARNYMAHRHNAVVSKHRQNSLATYKALVEAAGEEANRDIVLTKAAESIFTAHLTGFTKGDGSDTGNMSMVTVQPSFKPPIG